MMEIEDLKWAIACAENNVSKLSQDVSKVIGMSTAKTRSLINNICSTHLGVSYLEIGVWLGATLVSAMYKNVGTFVGVDDFSEFQVPISYGTKFIGVNVDCDMVKSEMKDQKGAIDKLVDKFGNGQAIFYQEDAFEMCLDKVPMLDVFYYDGDHVYEKQKLGIERYSEKFKDTCVLFVDDANWKSVHNGTQDALKNISFEIDYERLLSREDGAENDLDGWFNGLYVALLRRR